MSRTMWKASYLVCTIKTVVHEPRNDGRFPDRLVAKENEFIFGQRVDLELICAVAAHGERSLERTKTRKENTSRSRLLPSFFLAEARGRLPTWHNLPIKIHSFASCLRPKIRAQELSTLNSTRHKRLTISLAFYVQTVFPSSVFCACVSS